MTELVTLFAKTGKALQENLILPVHKFYKNFLGREARHEFCQVISNFLFLKGQDAAIFMVILTSAGIACSHLAQYKGLKKSNRENKDYLMLQEKVEGVIETALSFIPAPILYGLKKKIEGGEITTRADKKKLLELVAPAAGVTRDELYDVSQYPPYLKVVASAFNSLGLILKDKLTFIPEKYWDKLHIKPPEINKSVPKASMMDIAIKADKFSGKNGIEGLYNKKAYDHIIGGVEGAGILVSILLTIITCNLFMPYLKNKLSNYFTAKQLKEMGETPDSIRRKKLYGPLFELSELNRPEGNIFDIYSSESNNIPSAKEINASELERYKNVYMHRGLQNQIFNEINSVQTQPVTNGFLKI